MYVFDIRNQKSSFIKTFFGNSTIVYRGTITPYFENFKENSKKKLSKKNKPPKAHFTSTQITKFVQFPKLNSLLFWIEFSNSSKTSLFLEVECSLRCRERFIIFYFVVGAREEFNL